MIDYLPQEKIDKLLSVVQKRKYPARDKLVVLMMANHGIGKTDLVKIQWSDIKDNTVYIKRGGGSDDTVHPLFPEEIKLLKKLDKTKTYVFLSQYETQLKPESIDSILRNLSELANIEKVNPHALKHFCGYNLFQKGFDVEFIRQYLGHRNIQNTVRYTALDSNQFRNLWD